MRWLLVLLLMSARMSLGEWEYDYGHDARSIVYQSEQSQTCLIGWCRDPKLNRPFFQVNLLRRIENKASVQIISGNKKQASALLLAVFSSLQGRKREAFQYQEFSNHVVRIDLDNTAYVEEIDWVNRLLKSFDPSVPLIGSNWQFKL